ARLCGRIVHLAVLARLAVDRADVDDTAIATPGHPFENRLGHIEAPAEIDVDYFLPFRAVHPLHRRIASNAGIVDQHVDRAEVGFHLPDSVLAGVEVGDVPLVDGDSSAVGKLARAL